MRPHSSDPIENQPPSLRLATIAALLVSLASCGNGSPSDPDGGNGGDPPDAKVLSCIPQGSTNGWQFTPLGEGTKPALAVDADGSVHASFLLEEMPGWVRYTTLESGASAPAPVQDVANGYFYGPIDLVLANDGRPIILYHDHDREDQVLAIGTESGFELRPMDNAGHDGWYNSGVVDPDGTLHTVTYDPRGFSGRGLVYGAWDGTRWHVELAAPGSFDYAGGTAIDLGEGGIHAAFFDDVAGEGRLASRVGPDEWTVDTIEPRGGRLEVGRFPDMEVDPDGSTLHLVYLAIESPGNAVIRYARGIPGAFETQDLISITAFSLGFNGARDIATLALDEVGRPVVAVQSQTEMSVLRLGAQGIETIAQFQPESGVTFTQQTEVAIDQSGRVHLVWWQVAQRPGTVCHGVLNAS